MALLSWVTEFVRARHQFHVHTIGQVGVPMSGPQGPPEHSEEQQPNSAGNRPSGGGATFWSGEYERLVDRATGHAFETAGAFGRFDGEELIDWQPRGAFARALAAIDA